VSAIAEAFVRLRPDTTTFRAEAQAGVVGSLGSLSGGFAGATASMLKFSAAAVGVGTATVAANIALREILVGTGEFERELDVLQVVSGATADEMERISTVAKQLGQDITLPGTSAGDAAVAMNELAKAGLSIRDTLGGARGSLQLAAAGEIEVGEAAAIAGGALNVFGLAGDQATHVADLLAGASIAAQGEISDMALALQQSGAVARQAGLSIEQTVGAISLLAKNGVLGSDAGTSLRTTLLRLIPTTKEARQFVNALGIEFDENKTLGEQLPEVIESYRQALAKLNPTLQQQALTQIFGTDAIRAMSIFTREGAAGLTEMTAAVDRNGAANELATAKTKGFLGQIDGLKSQLSSLAIEVGEVVLPPLTEFIHELSGGVGAVTGFVAEVKKLGDLELPDWLDPTDTSVGEAIGKGASIGVKALTSALFTVPTAALRAKQGLDLLRGGDDAPIAQLGIGDLASEKADLARQAHTAGTEIGEGFSEGVAEGVKSAGELAVESARATLARVIQQGKDAVAQSIAQAQQNLASLGASLAADAGSIIDRQVAGAVEAATARAAAIQRTAQRRRQDEALARAESELNQAIANIPIMREIEAIQRRLDAESRSSQRTDVRRGLRDAQEALADARRQAQTTNPLDASQNRARSRFLRPFVEEVQDARGEVRKFNLETRLDVLQTKISDQTDKISENINRLKESVQSARDAIIASQQSFATEGLVNSLRKAGEAQKQAVTQGIADSIQKFNDGLITLPELNKQLATLLKANNVEYEEAGSVLGTAFVRGFEEKIKGLAQQARDIIAGPQDPGAGIRARTFAPAAVLRSANLDTQEAQRALQEALVGQGDETNAILREIEKAVKGTPPTPGIGRAEGTGQTTRRGSAADVSQRRTDTEVIPFRVGRNR
jgi:TP901 family phage tail tape measure protein